MNNTAKVCTKCSELKFLHDFPLDGHGYSCSQCAACRSEYMKKYRTTHSGKISQRKSKKKYEQSDKGKVIKKKYRSSEKGLAAGKRNIKKYRSSDAGRMKTKAREAVKYAIETGKLLAPSLCDCQCGKPAEQYHHANGYEKEFRLKVVPLCFKCHLIADGRKASDPQLAGLLG